MGPSHLKKGDLELQLVSHAEQEAAQAKRAERPNVKFESGFQKSLYQKLLELGYRVLPKYLIGEFEVDFLIQGDAGTKAVVSCDGDRIVPEASVLDRKSTRLNSSHDQISYAVFCLKK